MTPELVASLGPTNWHQRELWIDREGWLWSPMFGPQMLAATGRRLSSFAGNVHLPPQHPLPSAQLEGGPAWAVRGSAVVVDLAGPTAESRDWIPRGPWQRAIVPDAGSAMVVAVDAGGPVNEAWALHEGGLSQLRLVDLPEGTSPALRQSSSGSLDRARFKRPAIIEVARRPWADAAERLRARRLRRDGRLVHVPPRPAGARGEARRRLIGWASPTAERLRRRRRAVGRGLRTGVAAPRGPRATRASSPSRARERSPPRRRASPDRRR